MEKETEQSGRAVKRRPGPARQVLLIVIVLVILYISGRGILYLLDFILSRV